MDAQLSEENDYVIRIYSKTTSASLPDILSIIENYRIEEDNKFWFVIFPEINKDFETLYEMTGNWKTTKLWIKGKEIQKEYKWKIQETIFCISRDKCEGLCMHDLGMSIYSYGWYNILLEEKLGEYESVRGLKKWFEEMNENCEIESLQNFRSTLKNFLNSKLVVIEKDKVLNLNKTFIKETVERSYSFELEHCPIISREKTVGIIDSFPDNTILPLRIQKELQIEKEREEEEEAGVEEEEYDEEEYLKKQAEFIGDEIEKRLGKVLSEFFDKKG